MVTKITSPSKIIAALNYNENKVKEGKAECLHANGYLLEANEMNFYQKMDGFENRNKLNGRATTKTLHISLNFDPTEKLNNDRLIAIANEYMAKIGFENQPWLMYKHKDAGHPHIHIVTTTIQADGKRIDTYNIGRNQSEKARKEIELKYGLVKAEKQKLLIPKQIVAAQAEKIGYGKSETKKSITNVVNAVLNTYRFASLAEFNAVLRANNVVADRGHEDGRIYKHKGLIYRILDAKGTKVGVPIKASLINSKPILPKLEALFEKNKGLKEPFRASLKNSIDKALSENPKNIESLIEKLLQINIATVLRKSDQGQLYGITFIDHNNRCVFNGSDLGKAYSAMHLKQKIETGKSFEKNNPSTTQQPTHSGNNLELLGLIINPTEEFNYTPYQLKKKRKKKRKSI